jgi:hypothetical protein
MCGTSADRWVVEGFQTPGVQKPVLLVLSDTHVLHETAGLTAAPGAIHFRWYLTWQDNCVPFSITVVVNTILAVNARRGFRTSLMPTYSRRQIVVEDKVGVFTASPDASVEPFFATSTRTPERTIATVKSGFSIGCVS